MSVKIRLRRTGANNDISFRAVVTDSRAPRNGKYIESVGWYDPRMKGKNYELNLDRINYWVGKGAIVSDTIRSLVRKSARAAAKNA